MVTEGQPPVKKISPMVRAIAASEQSHFFVALNKYPCSSSQESAVKCKNPRSLWAVLLCGLNFFIIFVDNSTN